MRRDRQNIVNDIKSKLELPVVGCYSEVIAIVEALFTLELQLPNGNLRQLRESDVSKHFRQKTFQFHPDRFPKDTFHNENEGRMEKWRVINISKNILVEFCRNPNYLSKYEVKEIERSWKAYKRYNSPATSSA